MLSALQFPAPPARTVVVARQGGQVTGGLQWHPGADPAEGIRNAATGTTVVVRGLTRERG